MQNKRPAHRPLLPPDQRRIKADVTLSKAHHDMTKGPRGTRTKMVARALDALPLADELINAIGRPEFDTDLLVSQLRELELQLEEKEENPWHLRTLMNALPSITEKAKHLYQITIIL